VGFCETVPSSLLTGSRSIWPKTALARSRADRGTGIVGVVGRSWARIVRITEHMRLHIELDAESLVTLDRRERDQGAGVPSLPSWSERD